MNPAAEAAYVHKKQKMRARLGSEGVYERLLFHGPSFANSEKIVHDNFSLDKAGRVQTAKPPLLPGCQVYRPC